MSDINVIRASDKFAPDNDLAVAHAHYPANPHHESREHFLQNQSPDRIAPDRDPASGLSLNPKSFCVGCLWVVGIVAHACSCGLGVRVALNHLVVATR